MTSVSPLISTSGPLAAGVPSTELDTLKLRSGLRHELHSSISRHRYISDDGLANLKQYKYHSGLSSFLDRVILTPFWDWAVTLVPMWMAPNLLTTISLSCGCMAYALLAYFTPGLSGSPPPWVFYLAAILMFFYQTLDAIDGKQARRTGSSSPLGQLFDHGCDAICAIFHGLFLGSTTSSGNTMLSLMLLYIAIVPFYVSNWEEATTGFMRFGLIGVTEAQYVSMGVLVVTGLAGGPQLWDSHLIAGITLKHLFLFLGSLGVVYQCVTSVLVVSKFFRTKPLPTKYARDQSIIQIVEFTAFILLSTAFVTSPSSNVYHDNPRLPLWIIGMLSSYQVSRLIICHVTLDPYSPFWMIMWPLPICVINAWFHILPGREELWVWLYCAFVAVMYVHFIYCSINEITTYLGIHCFHIKQRPRGQSISGNVALMQQQQSREAAAANK